MHNKLILVGSLMVSALVGVSSSSFFIFWCMVELNTVLFIVFLWVEGVNSSELGAMKYFVIQGFGSLSMIWGVFCNLGPLLLMGSFLKLGLFPFHQWSLDLVVSGNWDCWLLLMTLQKVLPLYLVMNLSKMSLILSGLVFTNLLISCVGSLHKSSLKELMFYSSLFNMSLLVLLSESFGLMLVFFTIYCLLLIPCWGKLKDLGVDYTQQMKLGGGVLLPFLSLGGFPPTLGFMFKFGLFSVLHSLNYSILFCGSMIIMSLFMFYIYLSVILLSKLNTSKGVLSLSSVYSSWFLSSHMVLMSSFMLMYYSFKKLFWK